MERSGVGADLKQEANEKGSIYQISLVNAKAPLTTPKINRVMYQIRIRERRRPSMKPWKKYRVVMNRADGYGFESLKCGREHYW